MNSYKTRLESFTPAPPSYRTKSSKSNPVLKWPHPASYAATPASLADAGFYYKPSDGIDAVVCFMCGKSLAEWEREDNPADVHAEKCPKCPWVLLKCIKDVDHLGNVHFSASRLPSSRAMEKARLATFGSEDKKCWQHDMDNTGPSSKLMARAGFIYTPFAREDDTCSCVYCGIELSGWEPEDDPMEEHRRRHKKNPCPFFTESSNNAEPVKRSRSKSKAPPATQEEESPPRESKQPRSRDNSKSRATRVTRIDSKPEDESEPSEPKPSRSKKATATRPANAKSKAPSKRTQKKEQTLQEEVIAEYQVALELDEEAPPKPRLRSTRSKSGSQSSRSRSRSQAKSKASQSESSTVITDEQELEEDEPETIPNAVDEAPSASSARTKRSQSKDSWPKRSRSQRTIKKSQASDTESTKPPKDPSPSPSAKETNPPVVPPAKVIAANPQSDDDDMAREEEALEAQAEELMRAEASINPVFQAEQLPNPSPVEPSTHTSHIRKSSNDLPSERLEVADRVASSPAVVSSTEVRQDINEHLAGSPNGLLQLSNIPTLTEAERSMTVEGWVRHEMDKEFERLKIDGRQKIDAFIARAAEVARQIENL